EFCPIVCSTMLGDTGRPANASGGTLLGAKRQPDQMGLFGSPCSNSTQTPAPIGGTMYTPIGGPVGPARGAQGSHQLEGTSEMTSGTSHWIRPRNSGSIFWITVPRYLP